VLRLPTVLLAALVLAVGGCGSAHKSQSKSQPTPASQRLEESAKRLEEANKQSEESERQELQFARRHDSTQEVLEIEARNLCFHEIQRGEQHNLYECERKHEAEATH
jgi:hypothetical protein